MDKIEKFITGEISSKSIRPSLSKGNSLSDNPMFRLGTSLEGNSPPGSHAVKLPEISDRPSDLNGRASQSSNDNKM